MKTAIVYVILATAALTAANSNYMYPGSSPPMDHNDDIYNRELPSLVFNFEQLRRDQPPQVENRQEDLGRYMYRPRTSTVAPPPPMLDFPKEIPDAKILPESIHRTTMKPYTGPQLFNRHLPATIPPPPATPEWMDLSDTMKNKHHSHVPAYVPQPSMYQQEALPQRHAEPVAQQVYPQYPQYSGLMTTEPAYVSSTEAPYAQYVQNVPAQHHMQHVEPPRSSRGHHKFNWNDVAPTVPSQPMMTTPTMAPQPLPAQRKNPSSIPTLTPWYGDNFGK